MLISFNAQSQSSVPQSNSLQAAFNEAADLVRSMVPTDKNPNINCHKLKENTLLVYKTISKETIQLDSEFKATKKDLFQELQKSSDKLLKVNEFNTNKEISDLLSDPEDTFTDDSLTPAALRCNSIEENKSETSQNLLDFASALDSLYTGLTSK